MVLILFLAPKNIKPSNKRAIFKSQIHTAGVINGNNLPKIVPIPVTPPVAKPLGILKKYTPAASRIHPKFIVIKFLSLVFFIFNVHLSQINNIIYLKWGYKKSSAFFTAPVLSFGDRKKRIRMSKPTPKLYTNTARGKVCS